MIYPNYIQIRVAGFEHKMAVYDLLRSLGITYHFNKGKRITTQESAYVMINFVMKRAVLNGIKTEIKCIEYTNDLHNALSILDGNPEAKLQYLIGLHNDQE